MCILYEQMYTHTHTHIYIYTHTYIYSAIKKDVILSFAMTRIDLEVRMLDEINQTKKYKCHANSLLVEFKTHGKR